MPIRWRVAQCASPSRHGASAAQIFRGTAALVWGVGSGDSRTGPRPEEGVGRGAAPGLFRTRVEFLLLIARSAQP